MEGGPSEAPPLPPLAPPPLAPPPLALTPRPPPKPIDPDVERLAERADMLPDTLVDIVQEHRAPTPPTSPTPLAWWIFVLFGVLAVAIAVAVFAYTTRCPCAADRGALPPQRSAETAKPIATPPETHSTAYVLSWMGDAGPTEALRVHFLLAAAPYSTYSCTARGIFGVHGRVRVTLPKGAYAVRATFGDETQAVAHDVPPGALVTLTETTLKVQPTTEPLAAAEVPTGVCSKDQ